MKCLYLAVGLLLLSSVVYGQEPTLERMKEVASRNLEIEAKYFVNLCDDAKNKDWCAGYFAAVIATLKGANKELCLPTNDVGRFDFDGVWTINKSWLYRRSKGEKVTFYNALLQSLTEEKTCKKPPQRSK